MSHRQQQVVDLLSQQLANVNDVVIRLSDQLQAGSATMVAAAGGSSKRSTVARGKAWEAEVTDVPTAKRVIAWLLELSATTAQAADRALNQVSWETPYVVFLSAVCNSAGV
jgi:hypothetical protein